MAEQQVLFKDSAALVECCAVDRNHGKGEGAVAPHHELAPTSAHGGTEDGVSVQPPPTISELLMLGPEDSVPMPSFEAVKSFLREYYLHSRFEGRDGPVWGTRYSDVVTNGRLEDLEKYAVTCISQYDCNRGRVVWFGRSLMVLNPDEAPAQVERKPGNLTHIYGQSL